MNDALARIKDSIEISAINGGAFLVSMSEVEQTLRILSLVAALIYTSCRLLNLWRGRDKK